jgi:hypothetical protein
MSEHYKSWEEIQASDRKNRKERRVLKGYEEATDGTGRMIPVYEVWWDVEEQPRRSKPIKEERSFLPATQPTPYQKKRYKGAPPMTFPGRLAPGRRMLGRHVD